MIQLGNQNDVESIAILLVETWRSCYQDFLPKSFLDNLNIEKQIYRHQKKMESGIKYFVWKDEIGDLQGFASYGKTRDQEIKTEIELYTLYVNLKNQKKGIGKVLLHSVINDIKNQYQTLGVLVMEKNPYQSFYLKNNFKLVGKQEMDLGNFVETNLIYIKEL